MSYKSQPKSNGRPPLPPCLVIFFDCIFSLLSSVGPNSVARGALAGALRKNRTGVVN